MHYNQLKISLDGGKTFQDVNSRQGVIVKYENTALNTILDGSPTEYGDVTTTFTDSGVTQQIHYKQEEDHTVQVSNSVWEYMRKIRFTWARNYTTTHLKNQ